MKLSNEIDVGSVEGKLDLCKRNVIFCHVDCFCLQEKKEEEEVFYVPYTEATVPAMNPLAQSPYDLIL